MHQELSTISHAFRFVFITIRVVFYPVVIITYIRLFLVTCSQDAVTHPLYALNRAPLPPSSSPQVRLACSTRCRLHAGRLACVHNGALNSIAQPRLQSTPQSQQHPPVQCQIHACAGGSCALLLETCGRALCVKLHPASVAPMAVIVRQHHLFHRLEGRLQAAACLERSYCRAWQAALSASLKCSSKRCNMRAMLIFDQRHLFHAAASQWIVTGARGCSDAQ